MTDILWAVVIVVAIVLLLAIVVRAVTNRSASVGAVHQVLMAPIRIQGCSVPRRIGFGSCAFRSTVRG